MSGNDVLITGLGLLTSLGEGPDAHWLAFTDTMSPVIDDKRFAPYTIHPLPPELDWSSQIPRKEARQMEQWQRIGTYAAGLALTDAGISGNEALTSSMDMIVAAAGGERDAGVDTLILETARSSSDRDIMLNEKLTTELRPTLFLAQLSNLLAGNISIVHKVTGSSRTFMGEEAAGISALQTGLARIRSGQSDLMLIGGAVNSEHPVFLLNPELGGLLARNGWQPLWQRLATNGDGIVAGSGGAFLVLESRAHAQQRGARAYAELVAVSGNQVARSPEDKFSASINQVLDETMLDGADLLISGASGACAALNTEMNVLDTRHGIPPVRAFAGLTGSLKEAQMPFAVALAALAVHHGKPFPPLDPSFEKPATGAVNAAIALVVGETHSEGAALVRRA